MSKNDYSLICVFEKAVQHFIEEGRKIENVYDLLMRGGAAIENHLFIKNWSDLDLSVIVEKVNSKILNQTKFIHQSIKQIFPYKLTITVVSKNDFFSTYHHHGIKPTYYSYSLSSAISLLQKTSDRKHKLKLKDLQLDCISNISYLIHDLRTRNILLDINNKTILIEFFCHLIKRAKHIIRNAIFIMTGHVDEEIDIRLFKKCFPIIDNEFPNDLKKYKVEYENFYTTPEKIKVHIEKIVDILEEIHERLIFYVEEQLIKNEQDLHE